MIRRAGRRALSHRLQEGPERRANVHDISFGLTSILLTVCKSNRNAIRLYREFGFRKCGERKYPVFKYGRFQPVISMEVLL